MRLKKAMNDSPFQHCEAIARRHDENFPVGWFIPRPLQKYVFALYAFARTADDFADEISLNGNRLEKLDIWGRKLEEAVRGKADHPIFLALSETFQKTEIPPSLLADLLTAFRWDVVKNRYQTFKELEEYCRYSANPVGRAVLYLFGYHDPELHRLSDKICTGIQLVNHWQDIAIDLKKERVYLPEEDLVRFGYSLNDLQEGRLNRFFREMMAFQFERTRNLFAEGRPLLKHLRRRLRWQVELMWAGPLEILKKIEKVEFDVFRSRPVLTKRELAFLFLHQRLGRS
ncbi:MAG: squalene synthase HpnC [Deltaproteobacteria bacterium]|nr:squalene synthase HpnC [Deltaproteobacteria bacterium]